MQWVHCVISAPRIRQIWVPAVANFSPTHLWKNYIKQTTAYFSPAEASRNVIMFPWYIAFNLMNVERLDPSLQINFSHWRITLLPVANSSTDYIFHTFEHCDQSILFGWSCFHQQYASVDERRNSALHKSWMLWNTDRTTNYPKNAETNFFCKIRPCLAKVGT
jgi:hypothetical protein